MRFGTTFGGMALCLALVALPAVADDVLVGVSPAPETYRIASVAAAAPIVRRGTLKINLSLVVSSNIPNGTTLQIFPGASVTDLTYRNQSSQAGIAVVAAGKASKSFTIPYTWRVASANDKVSVSITVFANATKNSTRYSNTSIFTRIITLPVNGATTVLNFAGSI